MNVMRRRFFVEQEIITQLNEMAFDRKDAIERCNSLGTNFINHFIEVFAKGKNDKDFQHHCQEMQAWYDNVSSIVLKHTKKLITTKNLIDWFFTKGSLPKYIFSNHREVTAYNKLIALLTNNRSMKVIDAMIKIIDK